MRRRCQGALLLQQQYHYQSSGYTLQRPQPPLDQSTIFVSHRVFIASLYIHLYDDCLHSAQTAYNNNKTRRPWTVMLSWLN